MNNIRERANAHCLTLPGAAVSDPWGGGHDCWKVGDKMFALMGAKGLGVTIKCADTGEARMLIEAARAERAPYLSRGGWVLVPWGRMEDDELIQRITRSYEVVRRSLPKQLRDKLA